jgi:stearoyl-CoA desaturase (delta-9 desaturase)
MASPSRYLSIPLPNGSRISLLLSLPFALVHIASLLIFFIPFHWYYLVTCLALLVVRMFFVTAGYHRYFSHRSFKTSRVFQFVIAFMAMTSSQKGVLWWAAHHRHHHRHSDQELDLHSPTLFGFFWSHVGWIISDKYNDTRTEYIADFAKYPELRWLNKYHLVPPVARGATKPVIPARTTGCSRCSPSAKAGTTTIITLWPRRARASSGGRSTSLTTR